MAEYPAARDFFANQDKFLQAGCRPARKFNAERRKKIRRLGVLAFFKQGITRVEVGKVRLPGRRGPLAFWIRNHKEPSEFRDFAWNVPSDAAPRIQEAPVFLGHLWAEFVEADLHGETAKEM